MGYLDKNAYGNKREWVARRMSQNAKSNSLTEEQHEALEQLCKFRHDLHCNQKSLFLTNSCEYTYFWESVRGNNHILGRLGDVSLPILTIEGSYSVPSDYDWNDDEYGEYEVGIDSEDDRYEDKYEYVFSICLDFVENVNRQIEEYLRDIDEQYETSYCPTGATRIY